MRKLITLPGSDRRWRSWPGLVLSLLWLGLGAAHAATPLNGAWREVRTNDTAQVVLAEYRAGQLKSFDPSLLQRFPRSTAGSWVVIASQPPWDNGERVLTIYPPPLSTATVFANGGETQPVALALDDFSAAAHGHGRLAWRVPADLPASAPILLRFEPSPTLSAPVRFQLQSWNEYLQQDAQWLVFAGACFAVMLAMVLMALCFALMLRDVTYAWYAGYIFCYMLIQGIQTGFLFHPLEWSWLSGMAPLAGPAAVALSVAFASLFMMRFCELQRYAPLLRVPIVALAVGMIQLVLMRCSHIALLVDVAQILLNPLLMIGAALLLVAAIVAAARGSRQAWFFLAGWTPLLLLTAMTSAQVNGALPQLDWLNDASLAGGAFEAIVLSLGLADRALGLRHDRDIVRALADHDALTNVLNRRAWTERASALLTNGPPRPIALLFLDLDHFKLLNDRQGHNAGDRALVAVAQALATELRPSDLLGRYGGEEFVALLDGTTPQQAMPVATRLCRRVHRMEIPSGDESMLLSISIGVAIYRDGDDVESLVERADQAMYEAKLSGRNRVCLHADTVPPNAPPGPRLHIVKKRE
ncbi:diguanylate cyclase [Rhodanobacter sp. OK091]|uniref:sensor domain-containing diguanylate cyclase n=1 Tax=Rhodanobacter sp. OK091 TaxID=1881037 RepID=UPI000918E82A|nr:diguanylate cyclase [Rhodanobacter sp. OK091]SHM07387.1 diguanylate cyclase (GGDEF) domain-containing protein [Rhodanobacter sp. OK091]